MGTKVKLRPLPLHEHICSNVNDSLQKGILMEDGVQSPVAEPPCSKRIFSIGVIDNEVEHRLLNHSTCKLPQISELHCGIGFPPNIVVCSQCIAKTPDSDRRGS